MLIKDELGLPVSNFSANYFFFDFHLIYDALKCVFKFESDRTICSLYNHFSCESIPNKKAQNCGYLLI